MGHANVTTTMRHAQVLDEDVHKAVAVQAKNRIRKKSPQKSPRPYCGASETLVAEG
jgi:hypothetical protein